MKDYTEILKYQPIITPVVVHTVESLLDGTLTRTQFHNKKSYAKRVSNLHLLLEYTIAFEIASIIKENHAS